jgi:hypothetical protein
MSRDPAWLDSSPQSDQKVFSFFSMYTTIVMSSQSLRKLLSGGPLTEVCLVSMIVISAQGQPPWLRAMPELIPLSGRVSE